MPMVAKAQDYYGINDFADGNVNLGTKQLPDTVAGIVNIVLGFLGILATLGIIWGGLKMMTAGGNSDQSEAGRGAIVAGAIGLVVVLSAYAISRFVLGSLQNEIYNP